MDDERGMRRRSSRMSLHLLSTVLKGICLIHDTYEYRLQCQCTAQQALARLVVFMSVSPSHKVHGGVFSRSPKAIPCASSSTART